MKTKELTEKTKPELLALAARFGITGRHRMSKDELAAAIAAVQKKSAAQKKIKQQARAKAKTNVKPKAGAQAGKKSVKPAAIKVIAAPERKKAQTIKKPRTGAKPKAEPKRKKAPAEKTRPTAIPISDRAPHLDSMLDTQWQEDVERAKYELFAAPPGPEPESRQELPGGYGKTGITVLVRDPHWAYAYWEIEPQQLEQALQAIGAGAAEARTILRVYDITGIDFTGANARHYFDIAVNVRIGSWYLNLGAADRTYCVDLGLRTAQGAFHMLARAQAVHTPRAGMSADIDKKYSATEEQFKRVYALSGGFGSTAGSLTLQEMSAQRLKEAVSSPGISAGPQRKK
jgi:uncharacterized protein